MFLTKIERSSEGSPNGQSKLLHVDNNNQVKLKTPRIPNALVAAVYRTQEECCKHKKKKLKLK